MINEKMTSFLTTNLDNKDNEKQLSKISKSE